ncbi:hypothetical protein UlMin_011494 [Ulmus minor]
MCITFVLFFSLNFLSFTSEAAPELRYFDCPKTPTFNPNSPYQSNLNGLLSSLTSNATLESGFYNTTSGQDPASIVYGSFMCRGDVTTAQCQECVSTAANEVVQRCSTRKVAVIWYDHCMLRYTNQSFFGDMDEDPIIRMYNTQNITEPGRFNELLANVMNELVDEAAATPSGAKKFATKEENFSGFQTLYSLVQCTPDLSTSTCNRCLRGIVSVIPSCCSGSQGGNIMNPSCNIRYEVYPFYNITAQAPSPLLLPPPPPINIGSGLP